MNFVILKSSGLIVLSISALPVCISKIGLSRLNGCGISTWP